MLPKLATWLASRARIARFWAARPPRLTTTARYARPSQAAVEIARERAASPARSPERWGRSSADANQERRGQGRGAPRGGR